MDTPALPNPQGRPPGKRSPVDLDFIYHDPKDQILPILLVASPPDNHKLRDSAKNWHWKLAWLGQECKDTLAIIFRRIEIVNEMGYEYLTNWGPKTKAIHHDIWKKDLYVEVARLSYEQRQELEEIGAKAPVQVPNGRWNCQDWLEQVMDEATSKNIWTEEAWRGAVKELTRMVEARIVEKHS